MRSVASRSACTVSLSLPRSSVGFAASSLMCTWITAAPASRHSFAVVTSSSRVTGSAGTADFSDSAPVGATVIRVAWPGRAVLLLSAFMLTCTVMPMSRPSCTARLAGYRSLRGPVPSPGAGHIGTVRAGGPRRHARMRTRASRGAACQQGERERGRGGDRTAERARPGRSRRGHPHRHRRTAAALAGKIYYLRILPGEKSCADLGAPLLVISQFTLYADTAKGRRPSWSAAAPGPVAEPLVTAFADALRGLGASVADRRVRGGHAGGARQRRPGDANSRGLGTGPSPRRHRSRRGRPVYAHQRVGPPRPDLPSGGGARSRGTRPGRPGGPRASGPGAC